MLVEAAVVGREVECARARGPRRRARRASSVAGEIVVDRARVLRLRGEVPRRAGRRAGLPGRPRRRRARRDAAHRARVRSRRSAARGSRGSTSSSPTRASSSTRSTRCRGSRRSRCSRRCWLASGLSYPELITELIERRGSRRGADRLAARRAVLSVGVECDRSRRCSAAIADDGVRREVGDRGRARRPRRCR